MRDRTRFISTLWLTCSLALLACVVVAQILPWGSVTASPRFDSLRRNFVPAPCPTTACLSSSLADDDVQQVDALDSDDDELDPAVALCEDQVTFLLPCSFRKIADRPVIAPPSILSYYPLRC